MCGFRLHPGAQACLQRTMLALERTGWQGLPSPHGHDARLFAGNSCQHGYQFSMGNIVSHGRSRKHFRH